MSIQRIISSFAFQCLERIAAKGIGLVISVILARILMPETFGLLAIITVFTDLAQSFVHSGLGTALVQNKATEESDYSSVFVFSLAIATVLYAILWVAAPFISCFYGYDELTWPLRIMSFSLPISALSSVQNAKLQREMQFKKSMYCNLIATVLAGIVGISAAYGGAELWALVIYNLSSSTVSAVMMLLIGGWHPIFTFSWQRMKMFWAFGWKMLVSGLLCSLYNDLRSLIIAKRFSILDLAVYNKGQQFPDIITNAMELAIQTVTLPMMSEKQDEKDKVGQLLLITVGFSTAVVAPAMFGLASVAETLIPILLTEKWRDSVPYMVIFCLSMLSRPITSMNLNLIKAIGRSDLYMKLEAVRRIVMLFILVFTLLCFQSVYAIAVSFLISSVIDTFIIMVAVKRIAGVQLVQQVDVVWKPVLAGVIMSLVVHTMNGLFLSPVWKLTLQILTGVIVYFLVAICLKTEPLFYAADILRKQKNKQ